MKVATPGGGKLKARMIRSESEKLTRPRYDEDVRNARKTAVRFEREYARRAKEAAACDDEKKRGNLLFGNWMISRRIVNFYHFAECQETGIHEVAIVMNGVDVCTCGLFDDAGDHFDMFEN